MLFVYLSLYHPVYIYLYWIFEAYLCSICCGGSYLKKSIFKKGVVLCTKLLRASLPSALSKNCLETNPIIVFVCLFKLILVVCCVVFVLSFWTYLLVNLLCEGVSLCAQTDKVPFYNVTPEKTRNVHVHFVHLVLFELIVGGVGRKAPSLRVPKHLIFVTTHIKCMLC